MKKTIIMMVLIVGLTTGAAWAADLVVQPFNSTNTNAFACQDFETGYDTYDIFTADDFVVPTGETWQIETIYWGGDGWNGFVSLANAISLNCYIFSDNAGVPNDIPGVYGAGNELWSNSWAPSDAAIAISTEMTNPGAFTATLDPVVILTEGTYWLACYAESDYATNGQVGMHVSDTTNGGTGVVINPGASFGFPTVWTSITSSSTWSLTQQDIDFALTGTVLIPPTVTAINPNTGANDDSISVTITGTNFADTATVTLSGPTKADITATNVVVVSPTSITCDFDLNGAAAGTYDVDVDVNGMLGELTGGFTVTEAVDDDTTVDDDVTDDDVTDDDVTDDDVTDDDVTDDDVTDDDVTDDDADDDDDAIDDDSTGGDDDDDDDSGCGC